MDQGGPCESSSLNPPQELWDADGTDLMEDFLPGEEFEMMVIGSAVCILKWFPVFGCDFIGEGRTNTFQPYMYGWGNLGRVKIESFACSHGCFAIPEV